MATINDMRRLRRYIEKASASLDDADAIDAVELFREWKPGIEVKKDERLRYGGILYRSLDKHTTQDAWTPDVSPSLFAKVLIPDPDVIHEWEQPESTNGYAKGNKVTHNDKTWESLVDNNTWEPGVIGTETLWKEVVEE